MSTLHIERFGVQYDGQSVLVGPKDGPMRFIALCRLAQNGTLREIFSRFGPLDEVNLTPAEVDEIYKDHYGMIQDEDHATLILCEGQVINLEHDNVRGGYDRSTIGLDHDWVWCAEHGHQIIVPGRLFS